ncbi:MAG: shikimate kinase [Luminiphilus sp.]|nr:shikimate kinase [Luminiphilus sp.]MDG1460101.1 shikimate kinase [Luminiphilus sp.]MDG1771502.1 shikimate kinase [Luminiphilus sp.]
MLTDTCSKLAQFHPVFIEGMGYYDPRQPHAVANHITRQLTEHWVKKPPLKPPIVMIQGDPLSPRGISAITPLVAKHLGISRCLVCLDEHIADYHSTNADRENVKIELRYSQLVQHISNAQANTLNRLEASIDDQLAFKNQQRKRQGKSQLADYFRQFALLQEVSKAACTDLCGGITAIHTAAEISEFSVTSFYKVGLKLNLVKSDDIVNFGSMGSSGRVEQA